MRRSATSWVVCYVRYRRMLIRLTARLRDCEGVPLRGWCAMSAIGGCVNPIGSRGSDVLKHLRCFRNVNARDYPDPIINNDR